MIHGPYNVKFAVPRTIYDMKLGSANEAASSWCDVRIKFYQYLLGLQNFFWILAP